MRERPRRERKRERIRGVETVWILERRAKKKEEGARQRDRERHEASEAKS